MRVTSMTGRQGSSVLRRARLVEQAAAQRIALLQAIEPLRKPLALADQGLNAAGYVRRNPQWLVGGILLIALVRPRGLGKWLGRGWVSRRLLAIMLDPRTNAVDTGLPS